MQAMRFLKWVLAATLLVLAMWLQPLVPAARAAEMPDRLQLVALLRAQDFAGLEKRLTAIQSGFEEGRTNDNIVQYAFGAFGNSDDQLDAPLTAWVERMPKSASARLARGTYLEHRGWLSRGSKFITDTPRARLDRMVDYFRLAGADFDRALGANPSLTPAITGLMRIAMASGQGRDVIKTLFNEGLATNPQSHLLHLQYMHTLRPEWGGSVEAVKAHVARLAGARPEPSAKYMQGFYDFVLGTQAQRRDDLKAALTHFDRALQFGTSTQYLRDRAYARLKSGMGDAALEDARRVVAIAPNIPEYLGGLADIEMFTNRPNEAIDTLTKAIAVDALNPEFRKDRAFLLLHGSNRAQAEIDMEAAMAFGDIDPSILRARARFYIEINKRPLAVQSALRALTLAPKDSRNYYEYAQALYFNQDCKAHEVYAKFRRICPLDNHCDAEKGMAMPGVLPYFRCDGLPH